MPTPPQRTIQTTVLAVPSAGARGFSERQDIESTFQRAFSRCLAAAGLSTGALYLQGGGGGSSGSRPGVGLHAAAGDAKSLFGHAELLQRAAEKAAPLSLPSPGVPQGAVRYILWGLGAHSALLAALFGGDK